MSRRLGRFQKAFVAWHVANRARFLVPVRLKMVKPSSVLIRFMNHPECLQITARPSNLGVWVVWQGVNWDALLDVDVLPVPTRQGFRCQLCEGSPKCWPSLEVLWADHLFEPFLEWVNQHYDKADAVLLFGSADASTIAQLKQRGQQLDPVIPPINQRRQK
jgi:hypothetical protein